MIIKMDTLFVFLVSILFGSIYALPVDFDAIYTLQHFQYRIDTYFTKGQQVPKLNIQFKASIKDLPDMPAWLQLEQRSPREPAFLYGTPPASAAETHVFLEVIGWNKDDYSTVKKIFRLTILKKIRPEDVKYQVDFKLSNFNLDEILRNKGGKSTIFRQQVQKIWPSVDKITKIDKSINRPGGRYPLPGKKEGVFITLASSISPQEKFQNVAYCVKTFGNFSADFNISWCQLMNKDTSMKGAGSNSKYGFLNVPYTSVAYDPTPRDMSLELMLVFVPILVGILFVVILTYIMCCKREGVRKRDAMTPREQLHHHRSLRNASYQLRSMSSKDNLQDPNPNGRFAYGHLDEEPYSEDLPRRRPPGDERGPPSSPSTPESQARPSLPPPYHMPPPMPSDQASDTDSVPSGPPPYRKPDGGRW